MSVTATLNTPANPTTITAPDSVTIDVTISVAGQTALLDCGVLYWFGLAANDPGANGSASGTTMLRDPNNAAHWTTWQQNVSQAGSYLTRIWTTELARAAGPTAAVTAN